MSNHHKKRKKHNECEHHDHQKNCNGKLVTKVTVVLAELSLQIHSDTTITFPESVLEIKDIKKKVKLTQCHLLLPTNKLFVKGFVRKNIQYASPSKDIAERTSTTIASDLHSLSVEIPFESVTEIKHFLTKPVMPEINKRDEFNFFVSKPMPLGFPEKDEMVTSDLSQFHQESTQFYNELPFCELISSHIIEWDEAIDRVKYTNPCLNGEGYFSTIKDKMVIDITLRVLQNQQIRFSAVTNDQEWDDDSESD